MDEFGGQPVDEFGGALVDQEQEPVIRVEPPASLDTDKKTEPAFGTMLAPGVASPVPFPELVSAAAKGIGGLISTGLNLVRPTTWLPEEAKPKQFVIPLGPESEGRGIGMETPQEQRQREAREMFQVGKPLYEIQPGSPDQENELKRLLSRWSTPEGVAQFSASAHPIGGFAVLIGMVPDVVNQIKDAVKGEGTDEEKRDRVNDLMAIALMTAHGKARQAEVKPPETITRSAVVNPRTGQPEYGANHPEILKRMGEPVPPREERNTPQFGYETTEHTFLTRPEAAPVAKAAGQQLETFDAGDTQPHSDQIAAAPGSETPLAETVQTAKARTLTPAVRADDNPNLITTADDHGTAKIRMAREHATIPTKPQNEGFVDQNGNWYSRKEAVKPFKEITGREPATPDSLTSEDLKAAREEAPAVPTERPLPNASDIFKASDEKFRGMIESKQGDALTAKLASEMTEEQLKQAEPIIRSYLRRQADAKVALDKKEISPQEFINITMERGTKGKIFADVFARLNRKLPSPEPPPEAPAEPAPAPAPAPPAISRAQAGKAFRELVNADESVVHSLGANHPFDLYLSEDKTRMLQDVEGRSRGPMTGPRASVTTDFINWIMSDDATAGVTDPAYIAGVERARGIINKVLGRGAPGSPAPKAPEPAAPVPQEVIDASKALYKAEKRYRRAKRQEPGDIADADEARIEAEGVFRDLAEKNKISQEDFDRLLADAKATETDVMAEAEPAAPEPAAPAAEAPKPSPVTAPVPALFVKQGKRMVQVTPQRASEVMSEIRRKTGKGASELGELKLYDTNGKEVGFVTYNGNVWLGDRDAPPTRESLLYNASGLVWTTDYKGRPVWDIPKPPKWDELGAVQDKLDAIRQKYRRELDDVQLAVRSQEFRDLIVQRDRLLNEMHPGRGGTIDVPTVAEAPKAPAAGGKAPQFIGSANVGEIVEGRVVIANEKTRKSAQAIAADRAVGGKQPSVTGYLNGKYKRGWVVTLPEEGGSKPPAPAAPQTAAAKVETPAATRTYEVSFESPSGGRATVSVRRVKFDELPDTMKKVVEDQLRVAHELREWNDIEKWQKVKDGKTPITLWEKRESGGVSHNISLESPETEFRNWAMREDLYDKKYNAAGQGLRDKLLAEKETTEKAAEDKRKAEEAETTKKLEDFAKYRAVIENVQLPKGETQMMRVVSQKGDESFIRGVKYGDWFIHKVEGGKGRYAKPTVYKVSHFASGLGISGDGLPSLQAAKNYVRALIHGKARGNWIRADQLSKAEKAHLMEIGRAWAAGGDVPSYFKAEPTPPPPPSMAGVPLPTNIPDAIRIGNQTGAKWNPTTKQREYNPMPALSPRQAQGYEMQDTQPAVGKRVYVQDAEDQMLHGAVLLQKGEAFDQHPTWKWLWLEGPSKGQIAEHYGRTFYEAPTERPQGMAGPGTPSATQPSDVPGSQLAQLTQAIRQQRLSPSVPFSQRMKDALNIAGRWARGKDAVTRSVANMKAGSEALLDWYLHLPPYRDYDTALGRWTGADQRTSREVRNFVKVINRDVPNKLRQEAITNWIQADGNEAVLRERAAASKPQFRRGYELALTLTNEEKTLARNIGSYLDSKLEQGINAGLLKQGVDNYVTQIWKKPNTATNRLWSDLFGAGKLNPTFRFARQRIFENYFEGEQAGFVPRDKRIGRLIAAYDLAFNRALSARAFIRELHEGKAADGNPIVMISGSATPVPKGEEVPEAFLIKPHTRPQGAIAEDGRPYRRVDHWALRDWKWVAKTPEGQNIMLQGDMLVHPDYLSHGLDRPNLSNSLKTSSLRQYPFTRGLLTGLAALKQTKLSLSPFHTVQEGIHSIAHRVDPTGLVKDLVEIDLSHPRQKELVDHGLMVSDYNAAEAFAEGLSGGGLVGKIPGLGQLQQVYTDLTFQEYIPRLKMTMALDALERNRSAYAKQIREGKVTDDQIVAMTARQSNAAFGEQNYRMMGRNPTLQDFLRLGILAPDFLEARFRFVGQALKPYGAEQRVALAVMAGLLYTTGRIFNKALDDDYHWDKPFSIFHNGREYHLRTLLGDVQHLFTDPRSFWYNRLAPMTRTLTEFVTSRDDRGIKRTSVEQFQDFLQWFKPIPLQTRPGETFRQTLLQASGVPSRSATKAQELYKVLDDWKSRQTDVKIKEAYERQRQETHVQSAYTPLRLALRTDNLPQARQEYDKLLQNRTPKEVELAMRPYTGGNLNRQTLQVSPRHRKPFTGSARAEKMFLQELTPEQRTLYDQAVAERLQLYQKYQQMLALPAAPKRDQFGGVIVE